MIQRIQSVFLLLVAVLIGITFLYPLYEVSYNGQFSVVFYSFGMGEITGSESPSWGDNVHSITWGALIFGVLSISVAIIDVFLYKNRELQAKLALLNSSLIIIYYAAVIAYAMAFFNKVDSDDIVVEFILKIGIILPIIALIFNFLAYWRIRKDEKLVKSLDRIR